MKKINIHDLISLAKIAKIKLTKNEEFYLGILTKCSIWAGRYPLPKNPHQMPDKRKGLRTSEDLIKRRTKMLEYLQKGKIDRLETESDIVSISMGSGEVEIYRKLKERLLKI